MPKIRMTVSVLLIAISLLYSANRDEKLILCSFYPMYILTRNVTDGVTGIRVENMTKPQTGCLHDYQLTPDDMKKMSIAWLLVVNGGGMENFLDKVIKQASQIKVIDAGKGLEFIKSQSAEHNHENVHHHMDLNAHIWVSVSGAIAQVKNICDGLMTADPQNAEKYRKNSQNYIMQLENLKKKMAEGLSGISNRNIITFHEAFPYFAREFNLNVVAVIEREAGTEPSARELTKIIKIIKNKKVKAVFIEPQYPAKPAETIARETGIKLYRLDPVVTGPNDLGSYITIMESNLRVLQEALR